MPQSPSSSLEAVGIELWRGDLRLFSGLSFKVVPGQLSLVTGANGCGKTSLLRLVCGLGHSDHGTLQRYGEPLDGCRARHRSELAFLGHMTPLKAELTAQENLEVQLRLRNRGARHSVADALSRVGMTAAADRLARQLSAGQGRRLGLAAVWASGADLWVLDEPYSSLDADGERMLEDLLAEHLTAGGAALMASHQRPQDPRIAVSEIAL